MNKNIIKTKKKLTIIFTVIVSLVIIILGTGFLSFKYYKDLTIEKRLLNDLGKSVELGKVKIDNFMKFSRVEGANIKRKDISDNFDKEINKRHGKPNILGPLSYIKIKNDEIISYDIKVDVKDVFIKKILNSDILDKSFVLDNYLVRKVSFGEEYIVIFKNIRYDFSNYLADISIFILVTFIFSGGLYFIGNRFVNRSFVPVEENMKDMNNFIHNAGHELKTPIAVIDSNIQFIKDVKKYDESMMDEMKDETKKLNSLIDSLIKLSDIGDLKVEKGKVNLKDIVNEVLNNCNSKIISKKIKINIKIKKDIFIEANKSYLYILLSNLIGNAIKYNIENGKIDIFYKNGELIIKDTGIGILKKDLNKIFDRFYKVDEGRNTEGFGIGLSLVRKIIDIYSWDIEVESEEGKGSSFIVAF